jgi:hypothetical protein
MGWLGVAMKPECHKPYTPVRYDRAQRHPGWHWPVPAFELPGKARGRLAITDRDLSGTLYFAEGRVVGAAFGADTGQVALDAIGLVLGQGRFNFADDGTNGPANLTMDAAELQRHLEQLAAERQRIMAGIPSLDAVPMSAMDGPDDQPISVDRGTLKLLLRCDGRMSVLELARDGGLLTTLKRLANLHELRLIEVPGQGEPEPADGETIVLTRPTSVPDSAEGVMAPTPAPDAEREPAESGGHPRRPWWQGESP